MMILLLCFSIFARGGWSPDPCVQVWLYSIQSEVFSLNNMLCAWTLFLAVKCVSSAGVAPLRLGALFVGLCSCNQHTSILLFTPAVVWIYVNRSRDVHANILSLIVCGLVGLLPYLFIPYQVRPAAISTPCAPSRAGTAEPVSGRYG